MSAIPPNANVLGSALQSGVQQSEQSRQTDADKNARADRARQAAAGLDGVIQVEETDSDTQIHSDSGTGGGQGRPDAPPEEETEEPQPQEGITVDEQGHPHLDLSA